MSSLNLLKVKNIFNDLKIKEDQVLHKNEDFIETIQLQSEVITEQKEQVLNQLSQEEKNRILAELNGFGPIQSLLSDSSVTEILINKFDQIYFEKNGSLQKHQDHFLSDDSYLLFVEKLCQLCKSFINSEKPFLESQYKNMRITVISPSLGRGSYIVSLRLQPDFIWTLDQLKSREWTTEENFNQIYQIINQRENFLIVGGTGSGKTSFVQSVIHQIGTKERISIIEDTQELNPVFEQNISLLTRSNILNPDQDITMNDLLKKSLRLRPDRICVGEIRGAEATALLLALATGHDGSFGTLHARNASEALLRLEMLVQMGAPQWSVDSIRKLIILTVKYIFVVGKVNGKRQLTGIYKLASLESSGITLENCLL